ncbi:Uncharacterized protein C9E9.04 [Grifola frondosa]|uniref:Endoplasmic reticulum transmembrane protein n=1 Tax=Grifola frondosa TaxID=5627 RepID=A0A1C7MDC5_GRIFR|nr:Uncharacterized protein C9E9.04 [Grifola frondosa]
MHSRELPFFGRDAGRTPANDVDVADVFVFVAPSRGVAAPDAVLLVLTAISSIDFYKSHLIPSKFFLNLKMTVYYTLTFMLLAAEMATFCVLVAPLPHVVRKKLLRFLSESPFVAKFAYGVKIAFIFVGILFVDAVQRMWRVTAEADIAKSNASGVQDVRSETNFAARKFYSQRNTYLTGFCLFLSLVLTRTFYILLDLVHTQEEYAKLKQEAAKSSRGQVASPDQSKQIEDLKKKLAASEAKARDYDIVKKQATQNAAEYDRLATEFNAKTGAVSDKRAD